MNRFFATIIALLIFAGSVVANPFLHFTSQVQAVSAGISDPTEVTGCVAWLDGSDNSTILESISPDNPCEDGDNVRRWKDKSGNDNHWDQTTAAEQPNYNSTNDSVDPDGTDDNLLVSTIINDAAITVFIVGKTTKSNSIDFAGANSSRYSLVSQDGSSTTSLDSGFGSPTYYLDGNTVSWTTRDDVHTDCNDGNDHIICMSGASMSTWTINKLWDYGSGFSSDRQTKEIIIYNSTLSADDRNSVTNWLKSKHGI